MITGGNSHMGIHTDFDSENNGCGQKANPKPPLFRPSLFWIQQQKNIRNQKAGQVDQIMTGKPPKWQTTLINQLILKLMPIV